MEYLKEQFKIEYNDFKRSTLLDEDIQVLNSLNAELEKIPKSQNKDELIDIESNLSVYGFKMATVVGRLIGQYGVEKAYLDKKLNETASKLREGKPKGFKIASEEEARNLLIEELKKLALLEGVVEEYKHKMYNLSNVHTTIAHRLKKFDKNL